MRTLLIGLAAAIVGLGLVILFAGSFPYAVSRTSTGEPVPPDYSLPDLLDIFSENQAAEQRREAQGILHDQMTKALADVSSGQQSLRDAGRELREIALVQSPAYHTGLVTMFPAATEDEAYARCLLHQLHLRWSNGADREARRAWMEALIEQFSCDFNATIVLAGVVLPAAEETVSPSVTGSLQSTVSD